MKKILPLVIVLSLLVWAHADAKPPQGVAAPSNLVAQAVSSSQINLSWTDNSGNESGFLVERSLNGTSFFVIATVGSNVISYSNQNLSPDTGYHYRVRAFRVRGSNTTYSSYSNVAFAVTNNDVPNAPTNLNAWHYSSASMDFVSVQWSDNSSNEDGFKVERSTDGINFSQITITGINDFFHTDGPLVSGTYYYRVRAFNVVGDSSYSNTVSVTF